MTTEQKIIRAKIGLLELVGWQKTAKLVPEPKTPNPPITARTISSATQNQIPRIRV
jgi:hypothetical protein